MKRRLVIAVGAILFHAALLAQTPDDETPGIEADDPTCGLWTIEPRCSEGIHLQVNDISLYYEARGQGEPLLLLHGGGGSAEHFNFMLAGLAERYRVITPDSRTHGRSTDAEEPLSYRIMVEDMVALLDSLNINSAYRTLFIRL